LSQHQHGGRVIASPFVAVSWFHACVYACLSGSTAGLASNATTWCMRRRLASLETAKSHSRRVRALRDPTTRVAHQHYTTIPCSACLSVQLVLSCPVETLFSAAFSLVVHALYTTNTPCCVVIARSRVLNALLTVKTRHLDCRSRGAGSPLASILYLSSRQTTLTMATTVSMARVPFGELSNSRVQQLNSAKNRQNGMFNPIPLHPSSIVV
jgi:hypothetical protein